LNCRIGLCEAIRPQRKSNMPTDQNTVEDNLRIITDALAGRNQDQREIAFLGLQTIAIMVRKNQDYGSSVFNIGAISPDVSPEAGLRVRLGDKLSRINNLVNQPGNQQVAESITDTGHDASAYLLLWVIARMRAGGSEVCGSAPIILDPELPIPARPRTVEEIEEAEYLEGAQRRVR
jgi:hypothetical protein